MTSKTKILDVWIMEEHLSEGDIKIKDRTMVSFEKLEDRDYYAFLQQKLRRIQEKKSNYQKKHMGIAVYFDTFEFSEVVTLLREKFNLTKPAVEPNTGDKFRFAVYFDQELKMDSKMIFYTESGYILFKKNIPDLKEFQEYEEKSKQLIAEDFVDFEERSTPEKFNAAFQKMIDRHACDLSRCYFKVLDNLETDATNLHSFYVDDLNKAKTIDTENLDNYLFGNLSEEDRYDLDGKKARRNLIRLFLNRFCSRNIIPTEDSRAIRTMHYP